MIAVPVTARKAGHARLLVINVLALAPAQEHAHAVVNLAVELRIVLIAVISIKQQRLVVVGARPGSSSVRSRKSVQDCRCERIQAGESVSVFRPDTQRRSTDSLR